MEIGFVGLGKMGRPMAEHLLRAGHRVHVHNRSRGVVDELAARGAVPATSPREVAERAEMVMTCLTNTQSVEDVYFGPTGLYGAARRGRSAPARPPSPDEGSDDAGQEGRDDEGERGPR